MRRISVLYVLAALLVGGLLLIPLSQFLGYQMALMMFGGLAVLVGVFVVIRAALRLNDWFQVQRESTSQYNIMGIHGMNPESSTNVQFRTKVREALTSPFLEERPLACACIREEDGGFVGVVRMGTPHAHACHVSKGSTKAAAMEGLTKWVEDHKIDWLGRTQPVEETTVCNHRVCPLGGPQSAFAETAPGLVKQ